MFAAASKKGGVRGVSQKVGKEFADSDPGGLLPEKVKDGKPVRKADRRYMKKPKG